MSESEAKPQEEVPLEAARALVGALLEACGAALGPQLGVELQCGSVEVDVETEEPEGPLAVQPLLLRRGKRLLGSIEIVSPLSEIVALARRANGAEGGDEKEELDDSDLDAIGKLLELAAGSLDAALRVQLGKRLGDGAVVEAGKWWRPEEPGDSTFCAEGPFVVGAATLCVPGGPAANLFFRLPSALLLHEPGTDADESAGPVLLLDLDEELASALSAAFEQGGASVELARSDEEWIDKSCAKASAIYLSVNSEGHMKRCRKLRLGAETWRTPIVLCSAEPTRELVIAALRDGASQVLRVPAEPEEVLRVLALAQPAR